MEIFIVNTGALRQTVLWCAIFLFSPLTVFIKCLVIIQIVLNEAFVVKLKGHRQFNSNFLLFKKNELIVLHVIFGVSFEITPQLVQIETVLVAAALTIQEKLAKFTRAETGPNHPIIQHELVHGENGDCRLSSVVKCEVG